MTNAAATNGDETHIRAIIFRDGDLHVAQCLEYDIAVQAPDVNVVLEKLELTIEAEFAACRADGVKPCDCIPPAPNYYHGLWEQRSASWTQHNVEAPIEIAFLKAA